MARVAEKGKWVRQVPSAGEQPSSGRMNVGGNDEGVRALIYLTIPEFPYINAMTNGLIRRMP